MTENQELFVQPEEQGNGRALLVKWLKFLFTVQLVSFAVSVVSLFGILNALTQWVSIGLAVCVVVAMFQLGSVNERYRKAFIFTVVQLVGTLGGLLLPNTIFSLVTSIGSFVAAYQQYQGHSEITEAGDSVLSRKWHSLFIWELVVGVIAGVISIVAAVIGGLAGAETAALVSIVLAIVALPTLGLQVLYLLYMKKTLALLEG